MAKLLVIDNYDSFTYNLVQMFMEYDLEIKVYRSDAASFETVVSYLPDYLLISPGPKNPADSGISIPVIKFFYKKIPVLGVCLGMQCINEVFGGTTVCAPVPMHGKVSRIIHDGQGIFEGLQRSFIAARYHSLMVNMNTCRQNELVITSYSSDGVVMGFSHRIHSLYGVQFHPESFLTENGFLIIKNFLKKGVLKKI